MWRIILSIIICLPLLACSTTRQNVNHSPKTTVNSAETLSVEEKRELYEDLAEDLNKHYKLAPNAEEKWSRHVDSMSIEEAREALQGGPTKEDLRDRSDFDNDGIRDSIDSDIDGDGKLNKYDEHPRNPYK